MPPETTGETNGETMTEAQRALAAATEAAQKAAADLVAAQAEVEREAARPKDRAEAEALLAQAEQRLADKERPGQDLAHARQDLATARTAMTNQPAGFSDEDWAEMQERIGKRIPALEQAVDNAILAVAQFNVSPAEIDLAAQAVHVARDFLAEFDAAD